MFVVVFVHSLFGGYGLVLLATAVGVLVFAMYPGGCLHQSRGRMWSPAVLDTVLAGIASDPTW